MDGNVPTPALESSPTICQGCPPFQNILKTVSLLLGVQNILKTNLRASREATPHELTLCQILETRAVLKPLSPWGGTLTLLEGRVGSQGLGSLEEDRRGAGLSPPVWLPTVEAWGVGWALPGHWQVAPQE